MSEQEIIEKMKKGACICYAVIRGGVCLSIKGDLIPIPIVAFLSLRANKIIGKARTTKCDQRYPRNTTVDVYEFQESQQ